MGAEQLCGAANDSVRKKGDDGSPRLMCDGLFDCNIFMQKQESHLKQGKV